MDQQTYVISFDDVSPAEANVYADELRDALLNASADLTVQRRRDNPHAQDFGATLVLILGTSTAVTLAKTIPTVIGNWLKLRQSASLILIGPDGRKMTLRNITPKQAIELAQFFQQKL